MAATKRFVGRRRAAPFEMISGDTREKVVKLYAIKTARARKQKVAIVAASTHLKDEVKLNTNNHNKKKLIDDIDASSFLKAIKAAR